MIASLQSITVRFPLRDHVGSAFVTAAVAATASLSTNRRQHSEADKERPIEKYIVVGDSESSSWRLLAVTGKGGTHGTVFHMRCQNYDGNRGHLLIESGTDVEMSTSPGNRGVYYFTKDKWMWNEQVNVVASIPAVPPLMTVGQLKAFISDSHMDDYFFGLIDPSNPQLGYGGAQYWLICLFGELALDGRVAPTTAASLKRFIELRFNELRAKSEVDPKYRIEWPSVPGHFPSVKWRSGSAAKVSYTEK